MTRHDVTDRAPAAAPPGEAGRTRLRPLYGLLTCGVVAVVIASAVTAGAAAEGVVVPGAAIAYGLPVFRVLLDVAALATLGFSLLPKLMGFADPERTEPVAARARRWAAGSALAWAFAALGSLVLSAADADPGGVPDLALYVDRIGIGQGLVVSASAAIASAAVGLLAVRFGESVPAELRVLVAGFGLLPLPVTGHASNWYWHDLSMVSMELHVLGASAWAGGLLAIALLLRGDNLAAVLPRFSKLATIALLVVTASGLFNGLVELALAPVARFPESLVTTGYGRLVLAKVVFAGVIALLGANIRWRLLPAIRRPALTAAPARSAFPAFPAFAVWVTAELAVMGLAYGVAVALTRAPVA
ncbi:CopD family protein [Streptosporangiaceae bacterium NEAU-GS5]|nr:CopD family protein [Streptosporangiaceae bacterium NEAU-GS5]